MRIPAIDFVARPRPAVAVLALLSITLFLDVGLIARIHALQQKTHHLELRLADSRRLLASAARERRPRAATLDATALKALQQERQVLQGIQKLLNAPLQVLDLLEPCTNAETAFLTVRYDHVRLRTGITAETRNADSLAALLSCMHQSGAFTMVRVVNQIRLTDIPQQPLKVEVTAASN
ncbi:MAG: hypothetical protein ACK5NY_09715 [Burkholderiaceae bacterium]